MFKQKFYEVVSKDNAEFKSIFGETWKHEGLSVEDHKQSELLLVRNEEGVAVATIEMATYDKGFEHAAVEEAFSFKPWQEENTQLIYIDKVCIDESQRGSIKNLHYLFQSMFDWMEDHQIEGKKQKICALIRKRFFRLIASKRIIKIEAERLGEDVDSEVPMLIDFSLEENKNLFATGEWM